MSSAVVKFAVFLFALCLIESLNAAATERGNVQDNEDAKVPVNDGIKARSDSGSFDILQFFKEIKTKADVAKIFGGLILKSKGGDSPLKL